MSPEIRTQSFLPRIPSWLIWYHAQRSSFGPEIERRSPLILCLYLLIEIDKVSPSDSLFAEVDSWYMRKILQRQASITKLGRRIDWFLTSQPMFDLGEHPKIQLSGSAVQVISCWCWHCSDHYIDGLCQGPTVWLAVLQRWISGTCENFYQGKRPLSNLVAELIDSWYYRRRLTWVNSRKYTYLTVPFESSHADVIVRNHHIDRLYHYHHYRSLS